jgi:glycosyltransferase 2 family protein
MKKTLQYLLFLGIGGGLIWYSIASGIINPTKLWEDVSHANLWYVGLMVVLMFVAHGSRAARWQLLLEPLGYKPSFFNVNNAVWLGYFANNLVPRLGEVTRCSQLYKSDNIPVEKSLGTVVTDRLFDVVMLFILLLLHFILDFDKLWAFINQQMAQNSGSQADKSNLLFFLLVTIVLGGSVLFIFRKKILQISIVQTIIEKLKGLLDGLLSIRHLKNPWLFIFHSVLIWTMYYLMGYVLFLAIPKFADLPLMAGLTFLVSGALAMILPSPGGAGTITAIVSPVLVTMYGLSKDDAGTLATFVQSSQMLATLIIGAIIFLITVFNTKNNSTLANDGK